MGAASYKWRKKTSASGPVAVNQMLNNRWDGFPSSKCTRAAELYLLKEVQKGLKVKGAQMLSTDVRTEEDVLGTKWKLIVLGSRGSNEVLKIHRVTNMPMLK